MQLRRWVKEGVKRGETPIRSVINLLNENTCRRRRERPVTSYRSAYGDVHVTDTRCPRVVRARPWPTPSRPGGGGISGCKSEQTAAKPVGVAWCK